MYSHYWSLEREPFENTLDPAFFFPSQTHQSALLKLRYLLENRKGAGVLVGPTGSGKTFVVHRLAEELGADFGPWVQLVFPQMSADDLLSFLAVQLGGEPSAGLATVLPRGTALRVIEQSLIEHTQQGRHPVIVVDDAHLIEDASALQALELLLNFQRAPQCVFSLILLGDRLLLPRLSRWPRFDERLVVRSAPPAAHFIRGWSPRESSIGSTYSVRSGSPMFMALDEVAGYIRFRLEVSGSRRPMFDAAALDQIAQLSGGTPRRINRLADLALLVGYADSRATLSAEDVAAVSQELVDVAAD